MEASKRGFSTPPEGSGLPVPAEALGGESRLPVVSAAHAVDVLGDRDQADHLWRIANTFAKSALVPDHFRGKPADCFVALQLASRMHTDGFAVLQNIHVVQGKPGFAATFAIAMANERGGFEHPIRWTVDKSDANNLSVTAYTSIAGQRVEATVDMKMARAEDWTKNKKYASMPEQMLHYRSATFLIRRYAPQVLLGLQTREELYDMAVARGAREEDLERDGGRNLSALSEINRDLAPAPAEAAPAESNGMATCANSGCNYTGHLDTFVEGACPVCKTDLPQTSLGL